MRFSRGLILGSVSVLITSAAAALFVQSCDLRQRTVYTDGSTIRQPLAGAPIREILWTPPQALPSSINAPGDVYESRLSADGLTLVFVHGQPGGNADIFIAHRSAPDVEAWGAVQPLTEINTDRDELGPCLSRDGNRLYFYSNREGGRGGYDLWMSERGGNGWRLPTNLGPKVNSQFHEYSPALSPDATQLYFASNRPRTGESFGSPSQSWAATLRAGVDGRTFDLYAATMREGGFDHAAAVDAMNSPYDEGAPAFSPAGDFLYFASNRPSGLGGFDLYRSRLLRGRFLEPTNLGAPINSIDNELDPALTADGFALYFSSDRALSDAKHAREVEYKLYSSRSREVFTEIDAARAGIDWAGLWHKLWPSLLWLLLGLLGLLALLALLRGAHSRRLSLLARCILASLLVHAVLMFLFSLWQVTTSIAGLLKRGETKVALTSAGAGESLYAQIRGSLTQWSPSAVADVIAPAESMVPLESVERVDVPHEHAPMAVAVEASPATPALDAAAPLMEHAIAPLQQPELAAIDPSVGLPQAASAATGSESTLTMAPQHAVDPTARTEPSSAARQMNHAASVEPLQRQLVAAESTRREIDVQASDASRWSDAAQPATANVVIPAATATANGVNLPASDQQRASDEAARIVKAQPSAPIRAAVSSPSSSATSPSAAEVEAPQLALPLPSTTTASAEGISDSIPVMGTAAVNIPSSSITPALEQPSVATALPGETPTSQPDEAQSSRIAALPATTRPADMGTIQPESATATPQVAQLQPSAIAIRETAPIARGIEADSAIPTAERPLPSMPQAPPVQAAGTPDFALPVERTAPGEPRTPDRVATPVLARVESMRLEPRVAPAQPPSIERQDVETEQIAIKTAAPDQRIDLAGMVLDDVEIKESPDERHMAALTPDLKRITLPSTLENDLRLPTETELPPNPYAQRAPEKREQVLEERGGSDETEQAVARALQWLAAHQDADGRWSSRQFDQRCGSCSGEARYDADVAITGLALLCFLGADHTHAKPGPYQDNVSRGVQWLAGRQKPNGDLRGDETMYSHGIATIALSEAYGMTRDGALLGPVQNAVNFIANARNTRSGGWRYEPGQAGDTSVLGWQVMAMVSAKRAGLAVAAEALEAGREWLDRVAAEPGRGLYAYQPGQRYTHAMTAEGMFVLQLLGAGRNEERMRESAEFIATELPRWQGEANTYYWYYGTLAMFQHQGEPWKKWNTALKEHLLANQRISGPAAGSWDPADNWARIGGRIYQTAMCTLSLEVYYRYLPLYAVIEPESE